MHAFVGWIRFAGIIPFHQNALTLSIRHPRGIAGRSGRFLVACAHRE
jgi:hypothetical protein